MKGRFQYCLQLEFYQELLADYPEELYRLFVKHIEKLAASSGDRGGYKRVCAVIRRLKKIGVKNEAALVKERLLKIQHKERNIKWLRMLGYIDRTDEIFGDDEKAGG